MPQVRADVAVIGAGPGGLSAAIAAAEAGASVRVLDAYAYAGGQYWGQSAALREPGARPSAQRADGLAAIARAERAGVRFHPGAEIWAIFPEHRVCATQAGEPLEVIARSIVIATGAYDRVAPFPGWTLPGVVTCGAAARLAKSDGLPIGKRVVVAGSGLFMLAAARAVERAGGSIVAYVEAQPTRPKLLAHIARYPDRWYETLGLLQALLGRRMLRRFGYIVTEALGRERIEGVRIGRTVAGNGLDAATQTIGGIDALVIGWGLAPSIELTALLRCRHAYDETRGGWYCVAAPETGRTSVAGVYAAGEVTGIAGWQAAQLSGGLAGAAAAAYLGFTVANDERHATALRRLGRHRAYAGGLNRLFATPSALAEIAKDDTVICRCEEVTYADVRAAIADGAQTVPGIKRSTRAGMGPCQGRICGWAVARATGGGDVARAGFNHPRIPLRPVPLSVVAQTLEGDLV